MIPAPLDAQFIRARVAVEVMLHQPMPSNEVKVITGRLLGTMMARGEVHHYRVAVGEDVVYLAPPSWVAECGGPGLSAPTATPVAGSGVGSLVREIGLIMAAQGLLHPDDVLKPEEVA